MAKRNNPAQGSPSPQRLSQSAEELKAGLRGIKIRAPNKQRSTTSYKSGLPKEYESES